jgi:predicted RNA-binding protein with TRAM domain
LGDELEVNIINRCPSGDGMSRIRGYVIVIPKAKPRNSVKTRVTQVGEKTTISEIIKQIPAQEFIKSDNSGN